MDQEFDIKSNAIDKKIDEKSLKSFREESAFRVVAKDDHFFHNSKALIKYSKGLFDIKIICEKQPNQEVISNFESIYVNQKIQFSKSDNSYEITGEDIRNITQTFTDPFIVNFRVTKFSKLSDNLNQFYRVIIPIPTEPNFEPFETYKLHINGTVYYGLVKLQIEDINYELYHFNNKDLKESYIAIDGTELSTDTEFEEATRTILKTFSLFTGNLYQSEQYFYRTAKLDEWWKYSIYKFENKHQNLISDLQIIHPYKFKSYLEHFKKEKFADIIGLRVSEKKYTTISNNIHKNYKIERIIHLLLEANKSKSLILRCSTYSVALETLSNIICDTKNHKTKPISNEKLAELIIS